MTTDNRMNEPSEAQIEAAAKALHETRNPWFAAYGDWGAAGYEIKQAFRESARAVLVAAQGAAPQAESEDNVTCRCGHGTGSHDFSDPQESCREIVCDCRGWFGVSPVLPSSGVDEAALAEVIGKARTTSVRDDDGVKSIVMESNEQIARAVAEWLKVQGGESRGE